MRQVLRVSSSLLHSCPQSCSCKTAGNNTAALVQHSSVMLHRATGRCVRTEAVLADLAMFICPVWKMQQRGAAALPCSPRLGPYRLSQGSGKLLSPLVLSPAVGIPRGLPLWGQRAGGA